jgi:hypothetical protein
VISHVTHLTSESESELKETLAIFRFYDPNIFLRMLYGHILPLRKIS